MKVWMDFVVRFAIALIASSIVMLVWFVVSMLVFRLTSLLPQKIENGFWMVLGILMVPVSVILVLKARRERQSLRRRKTMASATKLRKEGNETDLQ
jgi:membrane protein implicated in regulation of membrane protease activity